METLIELGIVESPITESLVYRRSSTGSSSSAGSGATIVSGDKQILKFNKPKVETSAVGVCV